MARPTQEQIEDAIDTWHHSNSDLSLHEYLGWTMAEYAHWLATDEAPNREN